jgi:hypothetical protein
MNINSTIFIDDFGALDNCWRRPKYKNQEVGSWLTTFHIKCINHFNNNRNRHLHPINLICREKKSAEMQTKHFIRPTNISKDLQLMARSAKANPSLVSLSPLYSPAYQLMISVGSVHRKKEQSFSFPHFYDGQMAPMEMEKKKTTNNHPIVLCRHPNWPYHQNGPATDC